MDDVVLQKLNRVVEQAVRPVRAVSFRKRRMQEELLGHLLFTFDHELEKRGDEEVALRETMRRFGDPAELSGRLQQSVPLRDQFFAFSGKLSLIGVRVMKTRFVCRFVLLTAVLLSAAWIIFASYMISTSTLFPGQQVLITASDGAELSVANGGLHVHKGSAGMSVYHGILVPAMAIPFTVILTVAVAGCFTILRGRDAAMLTHTTTA